MPWLPIGSLCLGAATTGCCCRKWAGWCFEAEEMTAGSAPDRTDLMDILKDNKSVTYGVDEASRHLMFVLSPRQTNCVNCLGGDQSWLNAAASPRPRALPPLYAASALPP